MTLNHSCVWLPGIVCESDIFEDCIDLLIEYFREDYIDLLYEYFKEDFLTNKPIFRGESVFLVYRKSKDGKHGTFWHLITEDSSNKKENFSHDKLIFVRSRCERIRWPKPIIEHESEPGMKVWENQRGHSQRILIWFEKAEYLVILVKDPDNKKLLTAFPVSKKKFERKYQKEFEEFISNN